MRRPSPRPRQSAALCVAVAAAACATPSGPLLQARRGPAPVAAARHVAIYLCHVAFGLGLSAVGRAMGRDRTSVRHACARVENRRDHPPFDRALTLLEAALRAQRRALAALAQSFDLDPTGDDT